MQHPITLIRSSDPLEYVPDKALPVTIFIHEKLGVEEVRSIGAQAHIRPSEGDDFVFVLQTLMVTHEAQNALLKLFEEPPAGLQFQLVVPKAMQLLPTLLSRVGFEAIHIADTDDSVWKLFHAATPSERLKQIEAWQKTKDPIWLQTIVRGVHQLQAVDVPASALAAVQLASLRLGTRGASNKMLLEHLALVLPLRK